MKIYEIEGKTEEEVLEKAKEELETAEENIVFKIKEEKSGFLKGKKKLALVIKKEDIMEYFKKYLKNIISLMGIEINLESKIRDRDIQFLLSTNQNAILIGKNGKTIESLQFLLGQIFYAKTGMYTRISLDIGEYKIKKRKRIEFLAKTTAKTVTRSKMAATLDPMNSYERRVVHTILSEYRGIITVSEGEGRDRHIIIKPNEKE